jgi:hypothetical protein
MFGLGDDKEVTHDLEAVENMGSKQWINYVSNRNLSALSHNPSVSSVKSKTKRKP